MKATIYTYYFTGTVIKAVLLFAVWAMVSSCKKEEDIPLSVDFSYTVMDSNYSIPVRIKFNNLTQGASFYKWTFEGGVPETYDKRDPGTITFSTSGNITIKLEAWNDVERKEKEITILIDSVVKAAFDVAPVINYFAPADVAITNNSLGASQYTWQFPGAATSAGSVERSPANVRYSTPGTYRIFLESRNDRGRKDTLSKYITVLPALSAGFTIAPSFDDEDYQAPLIASVQNTTISATLHNWTTSGGVVSNASDSVPTVTFNDPGTYTVTYVAGNGKQTQTVTQTITVLPNTGLRTFTNVRLGINSADATIGCFFSTRLRQAFKSNEVNAANGPSIDLCFFGLNNIFSFNKFISPDSTQAYTFAAIPNAAHTNYINVQESCMCGQTFTGAQFDNVNSGSLLNGISIPAAPAGNSFTGAMVPRIVLFQNQAGKKGAIKIKQFVSDGLQSYILCDIKVQKD